MSNRSTTYTQSNGTAKETYKYEPIGDSPGGIRDGDDLGIWGLSIFERRLPEQGSSLSPKFSAEMANQLLINTTINMMALSRRIGVVNGTKTHAFNVYRFKNKVAFFLTYGLSITLGIPIIAIGLISLYVHNQGVSAITSGFLQLLLTTTGRTGLEDIVTKGIGHSTLGGYKNVSEELKAVEVQFGELVKVKAKMSQGRRSSLLSSSGEQLSDVEATWHGCDGQSNNPKMTFGFGLAHEVRLLRRGNVT